jgi:hypothetical protein
MQHDPAIFEAMRLQDDAIVVVVDLLLGLRREKHEIAFIDFKGPLF